MKQTYDSQLIEKENSILEQNKVIDKINDSLYMKIIHNQNLEDGIIKNKMTIIELEKNIEHSANKQQLEI